MALVQMNYSSRVLGMNTVIHAILPDNVPLSRCNVVYLLHGLTDNSTGWLRYTSCERYARERNLAVVLPEVQRSFYIDGVYGLNYFTYVSAELPEAMAHFFGLSREREKNYIMGLSMGGYGALKCALTYPERYAGCGSFSGVTDLDAYRQRSAIALQEKELTALLGQEQTVAPENDLSALLKQASSLPPIYLSCGEDDPHYPANCRFARQLEQQQCRFRFDHRPGGHSWDFWDRSIQDCFRTFFDKPNFK